MLVSKPGTMATTLSDAGSGIVTNGDIQPDGSSEVYFEGIDNDAAVAAWCRR